MNACFKLWRARVLQVLEFDRELEVSRWTSLRYHISKDSQHRIAPSNQDLDAVCVIEWNGSVESAYGEYTYGGRDIGALDLQNQVIECGSRQVCDHWSGKFERKILELGCKVRRIRWNIHSRYMLEDGWTTAGCGRRLEDAGCINSTLVVTTREVWAYRCRPMRMLCNGHSQQYNHNNGARGLKEKRCILIGGCTSLLGASLQHDYTTYNNLEDPTVSTYGSCELLTQWFPAESVVVCFESVTLSPQWFGELSKSEETYCPIRGLLNILCNQGPKIGMANGVWQCTPFSLEVRAVTEQMLCSLWFAILTRAAIRIGDLR